MFMVDTAPGVGFLGHRINTYLDLVDRLTVTQRGYSSLHSHQQYESSTSSLTFDITCEDPLTSHHFGWSVVVFHCGFNLHVSTDQAC